MWSGEWENSSIERPCIIESGLFVTKRGGVGFFGTVSRVFASRWNERGVCQGKLYQDDGDIRGWDTGYANNDTLADVSVAIGLILTLRSICRLWRAGG